MWKQRDSASYSVRSYYTAQTLDPMRKTTPLSLASPSAIAPVFIPGCGEIDGSCAWDAFQQTVRAGIDSAFVQ
jgi:4-phytase/acid phosphatase